jgi:hypothetical protein
MGVSVSKSSVPGVMDWSAGTKPETFGPLPVPGLGKSRSRFAAEVVVLARSASAENRRERSSSFIIMTWDQHGGFAQRHCGAMAR